MKQFIIDIKDYSLDDFKYFLKSSPPVVLSDRARERIIRSRKTLENILARKATTIYGINTGFGKLSSVRIADNEHESLQRNLIRSHAVGIGPPLNAEAVRCSELVRHPDGLARRLVRHLDGPDGPVRRQPEGTPFIHRSRFTTGLQGQNSIGKGMA